METIDKAKLLAKFKLAIGDMTPGTELDDYYNEKLETAQAMLAANDISDAVLASELGLCAIVLQAQVLMKGENIAENKTLQLLRNTLSVQTKGERYGGNDADGA